MILDRFRLDGKVALVTGANQGMGRAAAVALAEAGANVTLMGRSDMTETGAAITEAGRKWTAIHADLRHTSIEGLANAVEQAVSAFGRLDILVNNAGMQHRGAAIDFTEAQWDDILQVNLKSMFFLSQAAGKVMHDQGGGKIINIASLLSFQGGILAPAYAAAKHGVAGITKALANEWAQHGVNVNAIAPGYIDTTLTSALRADPVRDQAILDRIPAERWGNPDDMRGAVVFLASAASDYVHGMILPVDGGWLGR